MKGVINVKYLKMFSEEVDWTFTCSKYETTLLEKFHCVNALAYVQKYVSHTPGIHLLPMFLESYRWGTDKQNHTLLKNVQT